MCVTHLPELSFHKICNTFLGLVAKALEGETWVRVKP